MKKIPQAVVCMLLFIFPLIKISAQETLSVGSSVRHFTIRNLINHSSPTAKMEDFNRKLVILDFWGKGCSGCILSWPKLLALQKEFADSIQIVLMDPWDTEAEVRGIFEKRKRLASVIMDLPCSVDDRDLLRLFPITTTPLIVMIKDDSIRYIANGDIMKPSNISAVLKGNFMLSANETFIDNDERIRSDAITPFFGRSNIINDRNERLSISDLIEQSTLTRGKDSLWMGQYIRSRGDRGFVTCINSSVAELYRLAYSDRKDPAAGGDDEAMLMKSRVIWQTKDSGIYMGSTDNSIQYQHRYNYQLISPVNTADGLRERMKTDLDKYFGLAVHWEKRKAKCFVLRAEDTTLISYKTGSWKRLMTISMLSMNKIPMIHFIRGLEDMVGYYYDSPYPIIDETGLKGDLGDFSLEVDFDDPVLLDKALAKYKMHFTLEEREIKVLVIRDPPVRSLQTVLTCQPLAGK